MEGEKSKRAAFKPKTAAPARCRPKGTALREAVLAGAEEGEEAEVAEDLELLADFVGDVGVVGVESG
jgi:hypothetical protein